VPLPVPLLHCRRLPPYQLSQHLLLGFTYGQFGRWTEAISEEQEALRLDRPVANDYGNLAKYYLRSGQTDAAKRTVEEGMQRFPVYEDFQTTVYELAFLRSDTRRMEQVLAGIPGKDLDATLLDMQAHTEAYHGRMARSQQFFARAVDLDRRAGSRSSVVRREGTAVIREAEVGSLGLARQFVSAALEERQSLGAVVVLALGMAMSGNWAKAETICKARQKDNPSNTVIRDYWVPLIHGVIAMGKGDSALALKKLEPAIAFDLSEIGRLYPAYFRGQAYLQAHNGAAAATEFQKIIDHPTIAVNLPHGALAHLGLARAYALQGDTAKAKAAYQDFLTLWKDADPDIPILIAAKVEYSKLQ
jgi:tetratricopeptide (TPR) repeat protein